MKEVVSMMVVLAFLFSMNVNAQQEPKAKGKKGKTEKTVATTDKKSCSMSESGKKSCCAHKAQAEVSKVEESK